MVKTAARGITAFVLSVVFVLVALWWYPDTARAAEPVPLPAGPVDEVLDVPSRLVKSVTSSPLGDSTVREMLEAQKALIAIKRAADSGQLVTAVDAPKPITAPAQLARGAGAASFLSAAFIGWTLGANASLGLTAAVEQESYDRVFCDAPEWYQGVTRFVQLSMGPDCKAFVIEPNIDITPGTISGINFGGYSATYVRTDTLPQVYTYCYDVTGTVPTGYTMYARNGDGSLAGGLPVSPPQGAGCAGLRYLSGPYHDARYTYLNGSRRASPAIWMVKDDTGAVVAAMKEVSANPTRTPKCEILWDDGSVSTGIGTPYTDNDGIPLSPSGLGCKPAWDAKPGAGISRLPSRIRVDSEDETGAKTQISDQDVPDFGPDDKRAFETGNGRGLVLEKVLGVGVRSCMTWEADCAGWWTATDSGTAPTTDTGTYRCTYGGSEISLAECGVYRNTFDVQTQTPSITDPVTGDSIPWSAGAPGWATVTPTVTGGGGCGAAWSWNPVDWVLNPLKCAFIPSSTAVQSAVQGVETSWGNSWPVKAMEAGTTALAALQGLDLSGCEGPHIYWEISWPAPMVWDSHPFNACGPPYDFLALVSRVVLSLLVIGWTAWGLTRRVGAVVTAPGVGPA